MLAYLSGIDNNNMEILGLAEICQPMVRGGMRAQNARPRTTSAKNPLTTPVTPPPPSGGGGTQLQQGQPAGKPNRTQIVDSAPPAVLKQEVTTTSEVTKRGADSVRDAMERGELKVLDKEATSDIDSGKNESGSSDKILGMDKNTAIGVGVGLLVVGFLMFRK
jgi:hypothetical protein